MQETRNNLRTSQPDILSSSNRIAHHRGHRTDPLTRFETIHDSENASRSDGRRQLQSWSQDRMAFRFIIVAGAVMF
jgi:hypothetical protein